MKLIIDERLKHRLIGVAVIVSIGTIFAPALIKKSSHRFDQTISIQLPPKPIAPKVALPEKQQVFKTMKVAHVNIPAVPDDSKSAVIVKAEPISALNDLKSTIVIATKETLKPNDQIIVTQRLKTPEPTSSVKVTVATVKKQQLPNSYIAPVQNSKNLLVKGKSLKTSNSNNYYAVQLGTFSQQSNALALVNKLKSKGYQASYTKVASKNGVVYRVIVGQLNQKQQAILLQQRLANTMQLQGLIVTTRIS
ncbi:Sporulation domain-containing protein [Legionella busanensis]|uniref:Sporulation domain-containing protein n=1 Tax=Legionella busanensis TaxID=190655 RepID=A0A378JMW8_9GAMM|nr:SPOR domain-containing protein [Legionella busanensis]STX51643.1 Sporulation domain-containing protein [Legionella busanensis]